MPKEIKVTVNKDGTTTTDLSGYTGPSCLDAAAQLRALLAAKYGIQVLETNFVAKPELTQVEQSVAQRQQQQGGK